MAYMDYQNLFSDGQDFPDGAAASSTNVIDLGTAGTAPVGPFGGTGGGKVIKDLGTGNSPEVICQVTETAAGGTSLKVALVMSAAADLGTPTVLAESEVIATASLVAGYQFRIPFKVPHGTTARYLGLTLTGVGTFTAGKLTAGLAMEPGIGQNYVGY
jgi:hypothetical protein